MKQVRLPVRPHGASGYKNGKIWKVYLGSNKEDREVASVHFATDSSSYGDCRAFFPNGLDYEREFRRQTESADCACGRFVRPLFEMGVGRFGKSGRYEFCGGISAYDARGGNTEIKPRTVLCGDSGGVCGFHYARGE